VQIKLKALAGLGQLALVTSVIAGALYLSFALAPANEKPPAPAVMTSQKPGVRVIKPQALEYRPVATLSGVVENRTRTDIAAQVGGRVVQVSDQFAGGAVVKKGELLFVIEQADYRLALESTGAEIASAKSELQQLRIAAELSTREWRETYPDRDVPPLAAKAPQIAAAEARLAGAEASRKKAELALERTIVRAPFDARVLETRLDEGQILTPNQVVGAIFSLADVEVAAAVSPSDTALISPAIGRAVRILRPGAEEEAGHGVIVRSDAQLDARTRLGRLYVALAGAPVVTVGEFVSVLVEGDPVRGALEIPASALTGRETVWVVSNQRLSRRQVQVLSDTGTQIVVAPFNIGDGVVAAAPPEPAEGMEVRVLPSLDEIADVR
jgi:RND family efflux transporter MFP subunit